MRKNSVSSFDSKMVVKKKLSNGMHVVIVPTAVRSRVLVQMLYDVGSASEELNEKGLAHLLEHMIFKGTPSLPEGAVAKLASRYGAKFNAFTWFDMTSYFFEVDSNNWKPFIPLLADCMQNVLLDEQHLASEVKAVIQELRMRNDNPSVALFDTLFGSMFSPEHPYFYPLIGYKKDLGAMTAERLRTFYKKYYVPERATLFVVGDVTEESVIEEVERYFSVIPASGKTFEPASFSHLPKNTGFHTVLAKHWVRPNSLLAWTIPHDSDEASDIASMLVKLLGEGPTSILHKRLIDQDQIANSVSAGMFQLLHESIFSIYFQPRDGMADACVKAIQEELSKLATSGVSSQVLTRLLKSEHLRHEFLKENPTMSLLNLTVLTSYIQTGTLDSVFNVAERLSRVTPDSITSFVSAQLTSQGMMRIDTVPHTEEQKEEWRLEQLKEQELEQQILAAHVRTTPLPENVEVSVSQVYPDAQPIAIPFIHSTLRKTLPSGLQVVLKEQKNTDLCAFRFANLNSVLTGGTILGYRRMLMMKLFAEGAAGQTREELAVWFQDRGLQAYALEHGMFLCLKEDFEDVIKKYFQVFLRPDFLKKESWFKGLFSSANSSKAAFDKVKEQMIQMLKSWYDVPSALAAEALMAKRFPGSPHACTIDDLIKDFRKMTLDDVRELYAQVCNPSLWILSVAGNFDSTTLLNGIEKATKGWTGKPQQLMSLSLQAKDIPDFDVPMQRDQVFVQYVRESPLPISEISVDRVAVDLLSSIYFGGLSARMFKLREATGIFYTFGGMFSAPLATGFERTQDGVYSIVSPEKLSEACALFESFLRNVFLSPVTQEEFDTAVHTMRSKIAESAVGSLNLANHFVNLAFFHRDEDYRKRYLDVLESLTPAIVQEVAVRYGQNGKFVRVRVGTIPNSV